MRKKRVPAQSKRCQVGAGTAEQCRAPRQLDSEYCFFHDRGAQAHREALTKLERLRLATASEIHEFLADMVKAVAERRLDPQQAYAIGWLLRQLRENLSAVEAERAEHAEGGYEGWTAEEVEEQAQEECAEEEEEEEESEEEREES
jgi:hypothetical protein